MAKKLGIVKHMVSNDLLSESLPSVPITEICADKRVLIEHHSGILEYSNTEIHIAVKFGRICVIGTKLQIACMCKEQLVIVGDISEIRLMKGKQS